MTNGPDWNARYKGQEFAYGKAPNQFFETWLPEFEPSSILMPADGEGRNGVFAAKLGWKVTSFDQSVEGQSKALQLAREEGVTLEYIVGDLAQLDFEKSSFDAIGLIYAHFDGDKKADFHSKLNEYLKPGGVIILEAFSKNHLRYREENPKVGGPMDIDMLYDVAEIERDFGTYEILKLAKEEVMLDEGKYHLGKGSVIRFVGRKKI